MTRTIDSNKKLYVFGIYSCAYTDSTVASFTTGIYNSNKEVVDFIGGQGPMKVEELFWSNAPSDVVIWLNSPNATLYKLTLDEDSKRWLEHEIQLGDQITKSRAAEMLLRGYNIIHVIKALRAMSPKGKTFGLKDTKDFVDNIRDGLISIGLLPEKKMVESQRGGSILQYFAPTFNHPLEAYQGILYAGSVE